MKSFYNEYEAFGEEGRELCKEIHEATKPIIVKYFDEGFHLREILLIVIQEISGTISEMILRSAMQKRKKEREEFKEKCKNKKNTDEEPYDVRDLHNIPEFFD